MMKKYEDISKLFDPYDATPFQVAEKLNEVIDTVNGITQLLRTLSKMGDRICDVIEEDLGEERANFDRYTDQRDG